MKERIQNILKKMYPDFNDEMINRLTQIYLFHSVENEKTLLKKGDK